MSTRLSGERQQTLVPHSNTADNVVGVAASYGGIRALSKLVSALPAYFPAAIVVVQHSCAEYPSYLANILSQHTSLRVKQAIGGELLCTGTIYTAVPDKHLLVNPDGTLSLSDEPRVNFTRPAADKLFSSLADSYKNRAIAVVLTGKNNDGALGVVAIKKCGGTVIAQDQATSECFTMPQAAIETGKVDWVLPLEAIAPTLVSLVMTKTVA